MSPGQVETLASTTAAPPLRSSRPAASATNPHAHGERHEPKVRYQPLAVVALAVCAGIASDRMASSDTPISCEAWWLAGIVVGIAWLLFWRSHRNVGASLAMAALLAATGGAWHHARWNLFDQNELGRFATEDPCPIDIEVVVASAPQSVAAPPSDPLRTIPAKPETRFAADAVAVRDGFAWRPVSGRTRIRLDGARDDLRVGDRLRIFGQLQASIPPANPGEFDFAAHARADRELCSVRAEFPECIEVLKPASAWNVKYWLGELRHSGNRQLQRYLAPQNTALASALLLGERQQLGRETNDAFLQTGTVHILSISGMHVAILAMALFSAFRTGFMSRPLALLAVALITGIYMLLTGADPPVVRATLLVWIVCGSLWYGRINLGLNSLAFAALVVLAVNPADLFRIGVILSFLSVGALVWIVPKMLPPTEQEPLDKLIAATRPRAQRWANRFGRKIALAGAVSIVLWMLTTPITMAQFHLISPVGLILNMVLAPFVGCIMGAGFGILLFGWLLPPVGFVLGWLCNVCIQVLNRMVQSAATWPASFFWTPGPNPAWLIVMFALGAVALMAAPAALSRRRRLALASCWCLLCFLATLPTPSLTPDLRCTFVSVGHGCAVVIELPNGKTLLYDAGRMGSPDAAERSLSGFLWSKHITHLDAIIVSHADADHYNALPALLDKFSAGAIYFGPAMFDHQSAALKLLHQSFEQSGAKLGQFVAGDRLPLDDAVSIEVLHPPVAGMNGSDNAKSIVLSIEHLGKRILLAGDLESPGLEVLMNKPRLDADILLAPHHGSARSDPPGFAAWSEPEFVVVSGGRNDDSATVRKAYEMRGATVINTARRGAVTAIISEEGLTVQTFRNPEK